MLRIEVSQTYPVSISQAFTYITDMDKWHEYWPDFIRIENSSVAKWSHQGDKVTTIIKLLNRERVLNMEMNEFQKDARVVYMSSQQGLPDVRHERHFKTVTAGCEYCMVVEYQPRLGFMGLFDRFIVKRSVERALQKTARNLDRIFRQQNAGV